MPQCHTHPVDANYCADAGKSEFLLVSVSVWQVLGAAMRCRCWDTRRCPKAAILLAMHTSTL